MARPKSNGPYTPLSATYYRDDAILEAGEAAELMFVRCLAFLADAASDGFMTENQIRIVVGMGLERPMERVQTLVAVGLLEVVDGGYVVRSWLKWNKSTEEIGKHLKRDRERKANPSAQESDRIPHGTEADSGDQYTAVQVTSQHVTADHDTDLALLDLDALFERAWQSWPKKDDKKRALAKFRIAARGFRGREQDLMDLIVAHGRAHGAAHEKRFTPALAGWLAGDRWNDELQAVHKPERKTTAAERALALTEQIRREEHGHDGDLAALDDNRRG